MLEVLLAGIVLKKVIVGALPSQVLLFEVGSKCNKCVVC